MDRNKRARLHYAWVIFAASFLSVFTALGFNSTPASLYLSAITEDLGISRSLYSITGTCRFVTTAAVNLFFGRLVSRFGTRKLIGAGFLCLVMSNVVSALSHHLWSFYLGGALLGAGLAWTTTSIVGAVVERWFADHKGTVMGFILASNGLGGALASQILTHLIYSRTDGWRRAYWLCAAVMLVAGLVITLLIRNSPEACGMGPLHVEKQKARKQRGRDWEGIEAHEVFHRSYFYLCAACVLLTGMVLTSVGNIAAAHMQDRGIDTLLVANAMSIGSLVLMCSKSSTGFVFDRLGLRVTMLLCQLCAVAAIILLLFVNNGATAVLYKCIVAFAMPLETIMLPLISKECFGQKSYTVLMGLMVSFNTIGYSVGPPVMNWAYDETGSYSVGLVAMIAVMLFVAVMMQIVITAAHRERKRLEG